jgi:hypothetical protein
VDSLKFSIRDSKHDILYKTLRLLATNLIKKQIQKAVVDAITTGMEYVDGQLVAVRDRVNEARASPDSSSTDILRAAFQGRSEDGEKSVGASSAERKSHFKVVAKRDSSILPKHGHPSGWAGKAQERAEVAATGDSWRSDAYVSFPPPRWRYLIVGTDLPSYDIFTSDLVRLNYSPINFMTFCVCRAFLSLL